MLLDPFLNNFSHVVSEVHLEPYQTSMMEVSDFYPLIMLQKTAPSQIFDRFLNTPPSFLYE